jgi:hypothetical protein
MVERQVASAVDRAAQSAGLAAKGESIIEKAKTLADRGKAASEKGKALAVKGLLAHYLISGLAMGSALLVLFGVYQLVQRSLDPAFSAIVLGLGVATLLIGGGLLATRSKGG